MGMQPPYGNVQAPPESAPPSPPLTPPTESGGGLATTGLVFGILTLLLPVVGVVLLALLRMPRLGDLTVLAAVPVGVVGVVLSALGLGSTLRRRSAIAGLILSIIGLIFALALVGLGLMLAGAMRLHGPRFHRPVP